MSEQNLALEKNNTTAGKLAEVLAIADRQAARIESLEAELTHCAHLRTDQAARIEQLETQLAAATLYINVNVCDPDTTAEMWEAWKVYQEALKVTS